MVCTEWEGGEGDDQEQLNQEHCWTNNKFKSRLRHMHDLGTTRQTRRYGGAYRAESSSVNRNLERRERHGIRMCKAEGMGHCPLGCLGRGLLKPRVHCAA